MRLIHDHNFSITKASKITKVPYDNAKAINRTYIKEKRIKKINYQERYQKAKLNISRKKAAQVAEQLHQDESIERLKQLL